MTAARRIFGPALAFAVILMLGSGIYLRIRGSDNSDAGSSSEQAGNLPEVSAAANFNTGVDVPVAGVPVVRDTLIVSVTAAGQAAASLESKILARAEGEILSLPTWESAAVRRGALLVAIDTVDLALTLRERKADLEQARAVYRERILFDDEIEDAAVRAERERVARAQSGLDQALIAVERAELELSRAWVRAPFAGRVANIRVSQGHRVNAGEELMTVVDVDPIKVEVQVLESEVGHVATGRTAQVTFAAFPGETFLGTIGTINPVIDEESRTARVTVNIRNRNGRIFPGMYARVSLEAQRYPDRILVPKEAVLPRDGRTMVFVFQDGLAKWTYVITGLENDSLVEITDVPDRAMLEPGEIVLTDGHYTLIHDARVSVTEDLRRAAGARPR
ncbi:MAG: efflux RND transporter periplasmic adaptor subunit [Gemmatimonadetes bacterium]|nr:efflux RND transporter periplasmic adaptor subunit [Gemmatimonadota bacterium]